MSVLIDQAIVFGHHLTDDHRRSFSSIFFLAIKAHLRSLNVAIRFLSSKRLTMVDLGLALMARSFVRIALGHLVTAGRIHLDSYLYHLKA